MVKSLKCSLALLTVASVFHAASGAIAADHLDAPALRNDASASADIADLYAFQSPANPNNTVLIMAVNPLAGLTNPFGSTSSTEFGTDVVYEFKIDNDGDAAADITYSTTFAASVGGSQAFTVTRNGSAYAGGLTGGPAATTGSSQVTAGLYDDPFFFDFFGFLDSLNFTGADTFAGTNVSAIVLEVPSTELNGASSNIGVWARTADSSTDMQIDRMGRPAINTVLISSKDDFNAGVPADDFANFSGEVNPAIAGLSDQANADALTPILLPDILTVDTSDPSGFLNGRRLEDDVIDAELTLLTGSSTPVGDGVDANDVPFLNVFPYLAPANPVIPEPSSFAILALGITALGGRRRKVG
ncbi:MAG: DUF4331 family protein [Lacipirellulaceae bacterium]